MANARPRASLDAWLRHVDELLHSEEPEPEEEFEAEDGEAA